MFLKFMEGDQEKANKRAFSFGVDVEGGVFDVVESGFLVKSGSIAKDDPTCVVLDFEFQVRRNAAFINLPFELTKVLGYIPAMNQIVTAPFWGKPLLVCKSAEDAVKLLEAIEDQGKAAVIHLVQVASPGKW